MKKKILASLIISLSLVCNQVQASAASAVGDYIAEHPEKLSKAKDVLKFGFKHSKTALRLTGKAGLKTAEVVKDHPFLALTGVAAVTGIALLSVDNAVEQIANHPEALDNYLDKNPEKEYKFTEKTINKNKENNDKYSVVLKEMHIYSPPENSFPNNILRKKDEQIKLEQSKEFADEYNGLMNAANSFNKKHKVNCSGNEIERFVKESPKTFNTQSISMGVPFKNDLLAHEYNVDQYSYLERKGSNLEADHIPSYKALELFFAKKHPLSFSISKKRNYFLASNASAINLDLSLHELSRTYKGANSTWAPLDMLNLEIATFKDGATLLVFAKANPKKYNYTILKSSLITLYERNKMLCLYD